MSAGASGDSIEQGFLLKQIGCKAPRAELQRVLDLSLEIFEAEPNARDGGNLHYSCLDEWSKRLEHSDARIFYAEDAKSGNAVAFLFVHPRYNAHFEVTALHVWLAGVTCSHRRCGLLSLMMESCRSHARSNFTILTISTVPEKFPVMKNYLDSSGWKCYFSESAAKLYYWFPLHDAKLLG